ncbi:lysophospholipid acyltransferase family protein [Roseibium marinum]|uniref:1-acyl-sn-glycerol-3-phosphate acyltransferase n=1 Tax=Roseibium marinum TaxID=281252 RepID=A0A2S3UZ65_9HYPH|nr:lysophospholipid acyltransferase family protein [Roseibium marinum]POF32833.1 1-acyl-sn-glycerol-3-phosphate acyltransferase [Roseibium marinum]
MFLLRSTVFQILFYILNLVVMIVFSPLLLLPRKWGGWVMPVWSKILQILMRFVAGIKVEVRGRENLPQGGFIAAMKHQSAWETFALIPLFSGPTFILKRELRWIPIFGWYTAKYRQIPINRGKRSEALTAMMLAAKQTIAEGRQILIFPEGTRRPAGAEPKYKSGVAHLYRDLNCPAVPIAHNSGLYWPRSSWRVYPGTVIVEILPPIEPGLPANVFQERMVAEIETASDRLIEEARQAKRPSPVLEQVDRLRQTRSA